MDTIQRTYLEKIGVSPEFLDELEKADLEDDELDDDIMICENF